jgi:hypothetical protein
MIGASGAMDRASGLIFPAGVKINEISVNPLQLIEIMGGGHSGMKNEYEY